MSIPLRIKVGPMVIRVTLDADPVREHRIERGLSPDDGMAISHMHAQTIAIRPDLGPDQMRDSLLHEVLHWCVVVSGVQRVGEEWRDAEEGFVSAISPTLLGVLRDNPELVEYLMSTEDEDS